MELDQEDFSFFSHNLSKSYDVSLLRFQSHDKINLKFSEIELKKLFIKLKVHHAELFD